MGEYICPECGARLDPGEKCDCEVEKMSYYEISDREIDRFYGESERPVRWERYPYREEEPDCFVEEDEDDGEI